MFFQVCIEFDSLFRPKHIFPPSETYETLVEKKYFNKTQGKPPRAFDFINNIHSCSTVGKDMCPRVTYLLL